MRAGAFVMLRNLNSRTIAVPDRDGHKCRLRGRLRDIEFMPLFLFASCGKRGLAIRSSPARNGNALHAPAKISAKFSAVGELTRVRSGGR
jgi:hypothetical protein